MHEFRVRASSTPDVAAATAPIKRPRAKASGREASAHVAAATAPIKGPQAKASGRRASAHVLPEFLRQLRPSHLDSDRGLCTKTLEVLTALDPESRQHIICWIVDGGDLKRLSLGCAHKVMQACVRFALGQVRYELLDRLRGAAISLMNGRNGRHVLYEAVVWLPLQALHLVIAEIQEHGALAVSSHSHGYLIMERLIEECRECRGEPGMLSIMKTLAHEWLFLCKHPYGKLVVRKLLQSKTYGPSVISELLPRAMELSIHRNGSFVLKAALTLVSVEHAVGLLEQLVRVTNPITGAPVALTVVTDEHGHLVMGQLLGVQGTVSGDTGGSRSIKVYAAQFRLAALLQKQRYHASAISDGEYGRSFFDGFDRVWKLADTGSPSAESGGDTALVESEAGVTALPCP